VVTEPYTKRHLFFNGFGAIGQCTPPSTHETEPKCALKSCRAVPSIFPHSPIPGGFSLPSFSPGFEFTHKSFPFLPTFLMTSPLSFCLYYIRAHCYKIARC